MRTVSMRTFVVALGVALLVSTPAVVQAQCAS